MSRRRVDKPLDIYKRLQVVRSSDDLIYDEETETFEKSKAMESDFFKAVSGVATGPLNRFCTCVIYFATNRLPW